MALKWTTANASLTIQTATARNVNSLKSTNTLQAFTKTLDNQASWIIGFGFQLSSITAQFIILDVKDVATIQCSLRVNTDGTLQIVRSNATALDSSSISSRSLFTNTWYYIEWKMTISNSISANTCKVNVNGDNWINVNSGQNIRSSANNTANIIEFLNVSNITVNTFFDDIYIADGTGSLNNDFLGDVRIAKLLPSSAGNYSQFTRDSGTTNFSRVNESANPDGDTSYVETSTANNIDSYNFDHVPANTNSVFGIQNNMWSRETDTNRQLTGLIRISGVDHPNANTFNLTSTYLDNVQIQETDPSTSSSWTVSGVNGAEYGFKLIA